uniref:Uncharacterized protein n=1 Tax=Nelumbo nucifera TaxID=4432 RepID=A0A822XN11_NELNU|nr:TPA_asm: hypothetical protein HUJ06_024467 [Nelumbo nucifera]
MVNTRVPEEYGPWMRAEVGDANNRFINAKYLEIGQNKQKRRILERIKMQRWD